MTIKQLFPSSSFCVGSLMDFKCPFPFKERRNSGARLQLSVEQPLMVQGSKKPVRRSARESCGGIDVDLALTCFLISGDGKQQANYLLWKKKDEMGKQKKL